jgi:hypothetical protein
MFACLLQGSGVGDGLKFVVADMLRVVAGISQGPCEIW